MGKPSARSEPTSAPSLALPGPEHHSPRLLRVHTRKTGRDWFTQTQVSSKSGPEDLLGASGTLDRNAVPAPLAGAPPVPLPPCCPCGGALCRRGETGLWPVAQAEQGHRRPA